MKRGSSGKITYIFFALIALAAVAVGIISNQGSISQFLVEKSLAALKFIGIMAWEIWWALVLGFAIAGMVEAWISKEKITKNLKGHGPKEIALGSLFGFVSSSCSFSAIATAKNLFKKGASAAASLGAFMFASTNLVIEIGLVMLVLLGWQFVVADFVGGVILIILMSIILTFVIPKKVIEHARKNVLKQEGLVYIDPVCGMEVLAEGKGATKFEKEFDGETYYFCSRHCMESFNPKNKKQEISFWQKATSIAGWKALADKQWKEWGMLSGDIIIGLILAGIIAAFIPNTFWTSLFSGQGALGLPLFVLWMSVAGAIIGILTFVCSVGNVPFAAVLWNRGLPFGGVLAYIYTDLVVPPIMDAYRKYYGFFFATILSITIFASAVITGFVIHFIFLWLGWIPSGMINITEKTIGLNYKFVLNIFFTGFFFVLMYLHKKGHQNEILSDHKNT